MAVQSSSMAKRRRAGPMEATTFLVNRVYYLSLLWLEERLAETGLGAYLKPGMGPVLFCLFETSDVTNVELVERTGLVPSTVSRTVRAMRESGLVSVVADPSDARAMRVRLTVLGRSLEPRCRELLRESSEILHRGLTPAEVEAVQAGLKKMLENFRSRVK